jgi:putative transcription antitermination factor YqgF
MTSPYLALDIGFKRTGVALSESGMIAQPLTVLEAKPPHMTGVVQDVITLVKEYEIATLVIGVPYSSEEAETTQALKVEQVILQIESALKDHALTVEIARINEFHSTRDAAIQYPTAPIDAGAAAIILQDFLDQHSVL